MAATITPLPNVTSIVPIFRSSGFDADATQNLGKAYDIACRSLHSKGRPPVLQEILAKKIVEAAQRDGTAGAWREITLWRIRLKRRFDF